MNSEVLIERGTTVVRRLRLKPGETLPWHRDPHYRVTVVLDGDALAIEFRDGGETLRVEVSPGQVDWEEPTDLLHRAVNVGSRTYEEVTIFLLDRPGAPLQPHGA